MSPLQSSAKSQRATFSSVVHARAPPRGPFPWHEILKSNFGGTTAPCLNLFFQLSESLDVCVSFMEKVRKLKCGSFARYTCEKRESHTPKNRQFVK